MKRSESFFSTLLENLGFLAAIIAAISQYFIGNNFKIIFGSNQNLYPAVSIAALILSLAIILGVYCYRFSFPFKTYINSNRARKYFDYLNKRSEVEKKLNEPNADKKVAEIAPVNEPFGFTILQLAFLFIILSLIFFALTIFNNQTYFALVSYILFICLGIASISIFSVQLYKDNEFSSRQKETDEIIMSKIQDYFSEKIKVEYDSTDFGVMNGPNRQIIFWYSGKRYRVFTKSNNPDNYFLITEFEVPKA